MSKISLKACRFNADLSAEELANKVGVSATTIYNWEKGRTKISAHKLEEISKISNIPIELIKV